MLLYCHTRHPWILLTHYNHLHQHHVKTRRTISFNFRKWNGREKWTLDVDVSNIYIYVYYKVFDIVYFSFVPLVNPLVPVRLCLAFLTPPLHCFWLLTSDHSKIHVSQLLIDFPPPLNSLLGFPHSKIAKYCIDYSFTFFSSDFLQTYYNKDHYGNHIFYLGTFLCYQ